MKTKNHGILKSLTKIQFHHKILNLTNIKPLRIGKFSFNEIKLDYECELDPQLYDSVSIFESMLTPVFLPNLDQILEPTFIPVPIGLNHQFWLVTFHWWKKMWISICGFGLNSWTKTDSRTQSWFSQVSIGSWAYHSWAQVNHSTKSHSFIGYRYRLWWLRDDFSRLVI